MIPTVVPENPICFAYVDKYETTGPVPKIYNLLINYSVKWAENKFSYKILLTYKSNMIIYVTYL